MKNPEERQKILKQVTDLEKNSINYFDVEKEFLLIDSDNLSQIRPRFYGYSIQRDGIYEEENLTPEAILNLNGRGCYVCVDVKDNEITIKQDLNGCWGIYLFRHGNYFALSTSFFRLLDHLKFRYPLTLNKDYCNCIASPRLSSVACIETAVNEIKVVDRSAILHIDRARKNLEIEIIDYKERSVAPDSQEGIDTLDRWMDFWSDFFHGLTQHTKFIQADLSGGFDSRIALVPLIYSGADLNQIRINSRDYHPFEEDYEIASQIAEHYGFKLNQSLPENQGFCYSFSDSINVHTHSKQLFSNIPGGVVRKKLNKMYCISGANGETLRDYWHFPLKEFMRDEIARRTARYSYSTAQELAHSFEKIFESNSRHLRNKYKIEDENSVDITQLMYHETGARYHFGVGMLDGFFSNSLTLSPLTDPEIRTLKLNSAECPDCNLLIALIFARYAPDLLKFKFQGNHQIDHKTIEYVNKINEKFPNKCIGVNSGGGTRSFHLQPRDESVEKILASNQNNPNIPNGLTQDFLKANFDSRRTYGLFTSYFSIELYNYAAQFYEENVFQRAYPIYVIDGVVKVIEDVEISQRNYSSNSYMQRVLESDVVKIPEEKSINPKFLQYITARIDIQLMTGQGDFQINSVHDDTAKVTKPTWLQSDSRIGYCIQSYSGKLEFVAKSTVDGQISIVLRGIDKRYPEDNSKFVPYWIDYTSLIVNEKVLLDTLTPAWHNKFYKKVMDVKAGEEIKIKVEWLPHRSDI